MSVRDRLMMKEDLQKKLGAEDDQNASLISGTTNAKLNLLIGKIDEDYLNNFGDGRMGDFVYGTTADSPMTDEYNRRVYYTESFTIPAGKTMKVTKTNNGMIVWARGDITIAGTLDISKMRDTSADPEGIPGSVDIAGTSYALAIGGSTPVHYNASRHCGNTGKITKADGTVYLAELTDEEMGSRDTPKAASVSGGALSTAKAAEIPYISYNNSGGYYWLLFDYQSTHECSLKNLVGAGALILICAGTIHITGTITADGPNASYNPDGQAPTGSASSLSGSKYTGGAGEVLAHQGGGGAVTLIAAEINNTGSVTVAGNAQKSIAAGTDNTTTLSLSLQADLEKNSGLRDVILHGGTGAAAYTCPASNVGNIKQYLLT